MQIASQSSSPLSNIVLWSQCLEKLRQEVPEVQFNTWVRPLMVVEDGAEFVLCAPNRFIRDFVEESFKCIGIEIVWSGSGLNEKGIDKKTKDILIKIDKYYLRPTEVHELRGDARKARKELGWKPKITFKKLVKSMVEKDISKIKNQKI